MGRLPPKVARLVIDARPTKSPDARRGVFQRTTLALLAIVGRAKASGGTATSAPATHPALPYVERGIIEMRSDPEASKRDADAALRLLQQQPDPDLEIRTRIILCDYQAERDTHAAEEAIEAGMALLPKAHRIGLKAGLLDAGGRFTRPPVTTPRPVLYMSRQ